MHIEIAFGSSETINNIYMPLKESGINRRKKRLKYDVVLNYVHFCHDTHFLYPSKIHMYIEAFIRLIYMMIQHGIQALKKWKVWAQKLYPFTFKNIS